MPSLKVLSKADFHVVNLAFWMTKEKNRMLTLLGSYKMAGIGYWYSSHQYEKIEILGY